MPENEGVADATFDLVLDEAFVELLPVPDQLVADNICIDFMQAKINIRGEWKY